VLADVRVAARRVLTAPQDHAKRELPSAVTTYVHRVG
jgi:hypothetical protein